MFLPAMEKQYIMLHTQLSKLSLKNMKQLLKMFLQAKKLQITTHKIHSQRQKIGKKTNLIHLEPPFNNFGLVIPRHVGADSCVVLLVIIVCG